MKKRGNKRVTGMAVLYLSLILLVSAFVMQVGFVYKSPDNVEKVESSPSLGDSKEEMKKISADIDVSPQKMDTTKESEFTVFIKLPDQYQVSDIDPDSVTCNGVNPNNTMASDYGEGYFLAQFNTADLKDALDKGTLTIKGVLKDGKTSFEGTEELNLI